MGSLLGCSLVALLLAGGGLGSPGVRTTIQDDATLLHRSDAEVRDAARTMSELGADTVRITAGWSALAPSPRARLMPRGEFDPVDSSTYPQSPWEALDRAIRAVDAARLEVQLDVAFWAPRWAVARPSGNLDRQRFVPDARRFAEFATAVAHRYSGRHPDPRHRQRKLPAVRLYTTWNEPNHPSFLSPQWKRARGGRWRAFSPHVYRGMHERAYAAIKAVSSANRVLVGGLSSFGSPVAGRGAVPPLEFLRTMACVDRALKPLRVPECRGAGVLHADGLAVHPYSVGVSPATSSAHPDDLYLADLDRASRLVHELHARGRTDGEWPLYVTEYGYETRPPDPTADFSPEQQARYLGWATFLAHRNPDVDMFAQFLLRDIDAADSGFSIGSPRRWRDWQTGLLYADGQPKPAAQAFKIPFFAAYSLGTDAVPALVLYGGVRPGSGRKLVRVERLVEGTDHWVPVLTVGSRCGDGDAAFLTDDSGFFTRTAAWTGPGPFRLGWLHGGRYEYGAVIPVGVDEPLLMPDVLAG